MHKMIVSYVSEVQEHLLGVSCTCGWKSNKTFTFGQDRKIRREYGKHAER